MDQKRVECYFVRKKNHFNLVQFFCTNQKKRAFYFKSLGYIVELSLCSFLKFRAVLQLLCDIILVKNALILISIPLAYVCFFFTNFKITLHQLRFDICRLNL